MRVVVFSSLFPSPTRPTFGVFVRERVRHLAALCDAVVVAPIPWFPGNRWIRGNAVAKTPWIEREERFTVYHPRVLSFPWLGKSLDAALYALSVTPFLAWLRCRFRFDVIDAEFGYPDGVAAAVLGKIFRRRVAITLRGDEARLMRYPLRRAQLRWALTQARVIAVSTAQRQVAVEVGVNADTVHVVANGVDASRFRPSDRRAARQQLGLPHDRIILMAVGSVAEGKGHHRIVEVVHRLVKERPELLYVVVGDAVHGDQYPAMLQERVHQHGLEQHVRMAGARPHHEIPLWLAAADLFCLATSREGWSNAITESLACGLPVVTTRVGGVAEIVRDGEDGFLVPFWNADAFAAAIVAALARDWDRAAIATRARQRTWDHVAPEVMAVLRAD